MSFEIISLAILVVSFLGIAALICRKIPALAALPASNASVENKLFFRIKQRIKNIFGVKFFSREIFLQKIISQARVWSLRADHKTANWLKNLRQKTQKNKLENSSYWQELKNSKEVKKKIKLSR